MSKKINYMSLAGQPQDIWGQSKNTANPVDCVVVLIWDTHKLSIIQDTHKLYCKKTGLCNYWVSQIRGLHEFRRYSVQAAYPRSR